MTRITGVEAEDHLPEVREPAGFRQSDAELHAALNRRLAGATDCAAADVVVAVRDAHVTLSGRVPSILDRQRVGAHACAVPGVLSVRDGLACPDGAGGDRRDDVVGASSKMGKPGFEG